jgi:hypothetical protein
MAYGIRMGLQTKDDTVGHTSEQPGIERAGPFIDRRNEVALRFSQRRHR